MTSIPLSQIESQSNSAKFEAFGDKHVGIITDAKKQQQTDPATGQPKFFASGDPMMLLLITIQPAEGDAVTLWAKGGNYTAAKGEGDSMQNAIAIAVRQSGAASLDSGAELAVVYTGESEAKGVGMNPAKLFKAQYRPPAAASVPVDDLFST